eukprot:593779-Hanusia_phi.AAC.1
MFSLLFGNDSKFRGLGPRSLLGPPVLAILNIIYNRHPYPLILFYTPSYIAEYTPSQQIFCTPHLLSLKVGPIPTGFRREKGSRGVGTYHFSTPPWLRLDHPHPPMTLFPGWVTHPLVVPNGPHPHPYPYPKRCDRLSPPKDGGGPPLMEFQG